MAPRYFTVGEANDVVGDLRPVVEDLVEHHRRFLEAQVRRGDLAQRAGANGGDLTPADFGEVEAELEREATALARLIERIQSAGAQVKDLSEGLLDFPSLLDGEEVLLCWRLGEDEIAFWHGTDEGFAGRKPLVGGDE